jgi:hypothetical protein
MTSPESKFDWHGVADDPGDFLTPIEQFVRDAQVLPHFDLGDELQDVRARHGEAVALEAEQAYRVMKEETN